MSGGYDLLDGTLVLEVAQLGPTSAGGYLADMGATVVKIETPEGDSLRYAGAHAMGSPDGVGLLHLRWNRGKQSIGLDIRSAEGGEVFKRLAERADVVIEGLRAGALERIGLGYDTLRERNPALVFCSVSGLGADGPYHTLGSFGPTFDGYAGLLTKAANEPPSSTDPDQPSVLIGMHAMGLFAAMAIMAALARRQRTGQGVALDVAGADTSAHWIPDALDAVLNEQVAFERRGFSDRNGRMKGWARIHAYQTGDGRRIYLGAQRDAYWHRFCAAVARPDLLALSDDDALFAALTALLRERTRDEWLELLMANDIPAVPVNSVRELATDPHFLARDNIYQAQHPGVGALRLTATPIKVQGQRFAPSAAPDLAEHTDAVLRDVLEMHAAEIERLRSGHVIY
jgi:crotonobetainyl-CoA:carnitine CoA-transferase CaiB-like acyl-CoA transferase